MFKARRLRRIFSEDGKALVLALDGFYFSNKTNGIEQSIKLLPEMIEQGLDAILVTYGMAKMYVEEFSGVGMLLRADMSSKIYDPSVPFTQTTFSVEDALRIGADGVISMTFPGAKNEGVAHEIALKLAKDADHWQMPFMCETLPYGYAVTNEASNRPEVIATAARLGTELGADIIKTRFTGTLDDQLIVQAAKRPVLALGGPKTNDFKEYLEFVHHCMNVGAKGVAVGRNVTQNEHPVAAIAALHTIIHKGGNVAEAHQDYKALSER
ncbi:class I fructose-bisphosphate aldolase [Cytobacillus sp. FSL K6-0265]|uniref:class I fructose-bisphosphate aldolase n=1 Tax=Cytobacillus sp. FSL K6-0265 TaxID=2921448 RepID=UPI0030FAC042